MPILKFLFILPFCLALLNSSCVYAPDLRAQTFGSAAGAAAGGLAVAQATSELVAVGSGIVVGGVFGSIFGQFIDNYSPLRLEDPVTVPDTFYYYSTLRPPLMATRFYPGRIIITADPKEGKILETFAQYSTG